MLPDTAASDARVPLGTVTSYVAVPMSSPRPRRFPDLLCSRVRWELLASSRNEGSPVVLATTRTWFLSQVETFIAPETSERSMVPFAENGSSVSIFATP